MAFSGIKLNFKGNECVSIARGKEVLPHRVDIIEDKLNRMDLAGLSDMFFNFTLKDCRNASTRDQIKKENKLAQKYFKLLETEGLSPDAA